MSKQDKQRFFQVWDLQAEYCSRSKLKKITKNILRKIRRAFIFIKRDIFRIRGIGYINIKAGELFDEPVVTLKMLEDSAKDLENWIKKGKK